MKSLILKDIYNIGHNTKSMLIMLIVLACLLIPSSGSEGYVIASCMLCGITIITTFSFDDMSKWTRYAVIMPLTRKDLVAAKFVVLFIFSAVGMMFGLLLGACGGILVHKFVPSQDNLMALLLVGIFGFAYSIFCGSIAILLVFRFGSERARMLIIVSCAIPSAINYGIYRIMTWMGVSFTQDVTLNLLALVPIITLLVVFIIYKISCRIFLKQEL